MRDACLARHGPDGVTRAKFSHSGPIGDRASWPAIGAQTRAASEFEVVAHSLLPSSCRMAYPGSPMQLRPTWRLSVKPAVSVGSGHFLSWRLQGPWAPPLALDGRRTRVDPRRSAAAAPVPSRRTASCSPERRGERLGHAGTTVEPQQPARAGPPAAAPFVCFDAYS